MPGSNHAAKPRLERNCTNIPRRVAMPYRQTRHNCNWIFFKLIASIMLSYSPCSLEENTDEIGCLRTSPVSKLDVFQQYSKSTSPTARWWDEYRVAAGCRRLSSHLPAGVERSFETHASAAAGYDVSNAPKPRSLYPCRLRTKMSIQCV